MTEQAILDMWWVPPMPQQALALVDAWGNECGSTIDLSAA